MIQNTYIYMIISLYTGMCYYHIHTHLQSRKKMPLRDDLRLLCSPPARCFEVYRIGLGPHRGLL